MRLAQSVSSEIDFGNSSHANVWKMLINGDSRQGRRRRGRGRGRFRAAADVDGVKGKAGRTSGQDRQQELRHGNETASSNCSGQGEGGEKEREGVRKGRRQEKGKSARVNGNE